MSTTTIRIRATDQQLAQFESQCQLTEQLLAQSLCRRFQIEPSLENLGIVGGWMASARSMGITTHITSGIQIETGNDQAKLQAQVHDLAQKIPLGDIRQQALDLCYLVEESGASPELTAISVKASGLLKAINELMA